MQSSELEKELLHFLFLAPYDNSDRIVSSKILCSTAFEHAESVKMLMASRNYTSAIALLRLQYEAFVRALWLLYAASDLAVTKLMSELTHKTAKQANKMPMLSEMLKKLEGKAPKEVLDQLLEFKEYSWKPLSSYIHGGIHAINRHRQGYPIPLLHQALKASNGVSLMVGMLLVILSGDTRQSGKLLAIQKKYINCCPELNEKIT